MSLLTVEERLQSIKRTLMSVRRESEFDDLVTIEAGYFMSAVDSLVSLVEDETFSDDELFLIWQALMSSSADRPVVRALANRVRKMGEHRRMLKGV